jgi:hypothetical protein
VYLPRRAARRQRHHAPLAGAFLFSCLAVLCFSRELKADPQVTDGDMAAQLLGKHALTLQWLGTATLKDAGHAMVKKSSDGTWHLSGRQDTKEGHVSLDGVVTAVDAHTFAFTGEIITNVSFINAGKDCRRSGDFTFAQTGKRRYWRLQQMDNPCDQATDYVDIYLR